MVELSREDLDSLRGCSLACLQAFASEIAFSIMSVIISDISVDGVGTAEDWLATAWGWVLSWEVIAETGVL